MGKFIKGQSGNPAGRPTGSRNRITNEARKLIEANTSEILEAMVIAAKKGDTGAAKLLLDRVLPKRLRPEFALPPLNTISNVIVALNTIAEHSANGLIDADEARALSSIIESAGKHIDQLEENNRVFQVIYDEIVAASPEVARRITERLATIDIDTSRPASSLMFAGDAP